MQIGKEKVIYPYLQMMYSTKRLQNSPRKLVEQLKQTRWLFYIATANAEEELLNTSVYNSLNEINV